MRITTGEFKGREVTLPRGSRARPVTGYVLEQVMNLFTPQRISAGPFLDVCAGSGIVGLEAVSRGAPLTVSVDVDSSATGRIRGYAREWGATDRITVLKRDGRRCFELAARLAGEQGLFACVFLDPPYISGMPVELLRSLGQFTHVIADDGLVIIRSQDKLPKVVGGLEYVSDRDAGDARLWLYRQIESALAPEAGDAT